MERPKSAAIPIDPRFSSLSRPSAAQRIASPRKGKSQLTCKSQPPNPERPVYAHNGRQLRAKSGHSLAAQRTGYDHPSLTFKIGPMIGRKARESGGGWVALVAFPRTVGAAFGPSMRSGAQRLEQRLEVSRMVPPACGRGAIDRLAHLVRARGAHRALGLIEPEN